MLRRRFAAAIGVGLAGVWCVAALVVAAAPAPAVADAAMQGDRDAVPSLLKQGADVNAAQSDGMTGKNHYRRVRFFRKTHRSYAGLPGCSEKIQGDGDLARSQRARS